MPPIHTQASKLCKQLTDETVATKRRETAMKLQKLVVDHHNQNLLLQQATGVQLRILWRLIINSSLYAADITRSKKSKKPNKDDLLLPHRLLVVCSQFSTKSKIETLLASKEVRALLKYCLDQLADDHANKVTGRDLMEMLFHLCSRPEYVAYFRPQSDMNHILSEIEVRISDPEESDAVAAKAFAALLKNAQAVGIAMHFLIPGSLECVYKWCKSTLKEDSRNLSTRRGASSVLPNMFGVVATLLTAHPEQCILDMSEKGRHFLKLAKRCYPSAKGVQKDSIIEYLLAHVLVCQTAGRLQGLLPGDLGDIGKASLDLKQIDDLLQVVAVHTEIESVAGEQAPNHRSGHLATPARTPSSKSQYIIHPVGPRSRRHFELCARLLACAQRLYLSDAEWNALDDHVQEYLSAIPHCSGPEDSFMDPPARTALSCPLTDLVESPWMTNVAGPLLSHSDSPPTGETGVEVRGTQDTTGSAQSNGKVSQSDDLPFSPILQLIADGGLVTPKSSAVPYLQLVCACAETYPLGECWTSNTQHYWHNYIPKDQLMEDSTCCNGCAPHDIALVVNLVTNILEAYGGPNGDQLTQVWALTGLIRLTESSALVTFASEQRGETSTILSFVWQRVWQAIFNSDLRYASYTRGARSDSLGEVVLVLLSEMVRQRCTEPATNRVPEIFPMQSSTNAFLHANQGQVWSLDAFSNVNAIHVQAVFDLTCAMLRFSGLCEEGRDGIDGSGLQYALGVVGSAAPSAESLAKSSRRYRLAALCLRYIEHHVSSPLHTQRAITGAACVCLLLLISGKSIWSSSTFDNDGSVVSLDVAVRRFCVTHVPFGRRDQRPNASLEPTLCSLFQCLWSTEEVDPIPKSWLADSGMRAAEFHESGLTISCELLNLNRQVLDSCHRDFVALSTASDMKSFVVCILEQTMSASSSDEGYEFDESSMRDPPSGTPILDQMVCGITTLKVLLSVAAVYGTDGVLFDQGMDPASGLASFLDKFIEHFPSVDQDKEKEKCLQVVTNLLQVLRAWMMVYLFSEKGPIRDSISSNLVSLFGMCSRLINVYSASRGMRCPLPSSSGVTEDKQQDSDMGSDVEQSTRPATRSNFSSESSDSEGGSKGDGGKKRRSSNSWNRRVKPRKDWPEQMANNYPTYLCAVRLASIMILLQPTYEVCSTIAQLIALPRQELGSDRRQSCSGTCDLDVQASLHCLVLFCSEMVIHRKENLDTMPLNSDNDLDETGSIVSLCCNLILQMRDSVAPSSVYYLFGFEVCADLVSHREKAGGSILDFLECKDIVELLGTSSASERKMLKVRPILRERQLAAATTIIRNAREGEKMRSTFDNEYKQELIINLCDLYESVRRRSTFGVGAALCVFPQGRDSIVATVKNNLPPLVPTDYRRWYETKFGAESNNLEAHVWEGALYSMRASTIAKLGVATGSASAASSMSTFRLSLFEMIQIASERPDLEALAFCACEKVAELAGFGTINKMFLAESEFLVERWLDTGKKLIELPLLLTAPTVLLKALKAGTARYLLGPGVIASSNGTSLFRDDARQSVMDDVRVHAAKDYLERSVNFLVPIACIRVKMSSGDERLRHYLKEISDIVVPKNGDTSLNKMICAHLSDILSFVEPFRRDTNPKSRGYGEGVVEMLQELITSDVYERRRMKDARLTVRRLLQRLGGEEHSFDEHCLSRENVEDAIQSMLPGGLEARPDEPFAAIGSSITECLLYSRFWLLQSVLVRQKQKRWSSIDLVCSFSKNRIINAISSNTQLGYCIHTIIEVLAEPHLECIFPQALTTLNNLLSEVFIQLESDAVSQKFQSEILAEMSTVIYRLIGTLLVTHERCQNALIEECLLSWEKEREFVLRSRGLWLAATTSSTGGVWGWDDGATKEERIQEVLGKFGCDDCLYSTLIGTYDALEKLLDHWRVLNGKSFAPMSSLSSFASKKYDYSSLERRNLKLCAQSLVGNFLSRIELPEITGTQIEDGVSDFLNAVRGLMMNYSTFYSRRRGLQHREPFLTIESKLLLDELRRLQGVLDNLPGNPLELSFRVSNQEKSYSLVRTLVNICEMSYADDIRSAACRCLGALGPCEIEKLGSIELELSERVGEQGKSWVDGGDHLQKIMSSCLEMLGQYLLSPRIETALTALQSTKAIVASLGGNKCCELIFNEDCKRYLAPLVESARKVASSNEGAKPKPKQSDFVLPTLYVDSLIARASSGVESTILDLNWCWREGLWKLDEKGELSYEEWVKGIACAMINCCYNFKDEIQAEPDGVRGSAIFFRYCVKLCALEHEFAARAFPGIVLDLLLNNSGSETPIGEIILRELNHDPSRSVANERLSECFSMLINCASSDQKGGKLPRESPTIKAVSLAVETLDMLRMITQAQFLGSRLECRRSRSSRASYGVVLCLDGLQVADACMRTNRFASAVFYADMYADEFYGGAGGSMERLANGEMSGSFRATNAASVDGENSTGATTLKEKLSLPSILLQSFTALGDYDAASAIEIENAAMGFLDPEFMWNAKSSLRADALDRLKALDAKCLGQNGSASTGMQIVMCMEDIGLESVLNTYIRGMVADQDGGPFHGMSPVEQSSLRDLWFRVCMTSMQWNQDFFKGFFAAESSKTRVGFGDTPSNLHWGSDSADCGFHECLFQATSSFLKDDSVAFRQLLAQARARLMHDAFLNGGGEAPLLGMISSVDRMQLLNDLEGLTSMAACRELALKWQEQNERALGGSVIKFPMMASANPLRLDEFVVSIREVMLRFIQAKNTLSSGHDFNEYLVSHLWQISGIARRVGRYDFADQCVQRLHTALRMKHPSGLENITLLRLRHEEAMIMESRGDFSAAIRGLRRLSSHLEKEVNNDDLSSASAALYADILLTCGQWVSRYKVEPGMSIRQNYLERAAKLASKIYQRDEKNRQTAHRSFEAHLSLAQLVLEMYDNAHKRVISPEWEKAGNIVEAKKTELENWKVLKGAAEKVLKNKRKRQPSDEKKYHDLCVSMIPLEKELIMMQEEREKTESSVQVWLQQGLQAYGNALALACSSTGESSDIAKHIYRVVSLWFANCDRASVNEAMNVVVKQIPSFRFVPLVYQIFSRIGGQPGDNERDTFQDTLKKLVFRMSIEHPYHCIVQLFALSNGKNVGAGVGGRAAETYLENVDDAKVAAANEIIGCLEQQSEVPYVAELVDPYRVLVAAYIRLANASTKTFEDRKPKPQLHGIPINKVVTKRDEQLDKCLRSRGTKNYSSKPCVLTKPPFLSAGGEYGDGIDEPAGSEFVAGFEDFFSITLSGISRPKILFCTGSKKGKFKQVVKGGDDIRQDAVMQQVFCYVNELMKRRDEPSIMGGARGPNSTSRSRITRALKNHLHVVTYSIVPLSPTSGVLEWAKDTKPFGDIVKTGVHSRNYPGEWTYGKCKDLMMNASTATEKRKQFDEICKNVTPAFRFFFTECFRHSLPQWYAAKMKYTRSCAVSSMVGHVLGIGDRHMHNILIRETTGEVVHIDFGIVFEQGKCLYTPETVPFRLTRDIVDGMGPSGTEGTFSRAAEATISVLRDNADALLTILSAVVSDPAYKFCLTPREAQRRQRGNNDVVPDELQGEETTEQENEAAVRALAKICEKLQGHEDGTSGERQSIEGQVQLLINSARNPDNLSLLYHGWSAWL